MHVLSRLRRPSTRKAGVVALTVGLAVLLAACGQYPDSIFHKRTDVNRDVDFLFKLIIYAGTAVFIFVEAVLIVALVKFRKRPGQPEPKHVHGNTTLEILWTVIPAIVLAVIAVPTVTTIFKTQAKARADALQVEVYGHQWWWEFRYPQYTARTPSGKLDTLVTANELYLPIGKTVNFTLKSRDVIHSFWVPALSGKRDVVSNHTNYLWYTPDSSGVDAWNGACVEYCGTSHANMRFKTFTVTPADFDSWVANQLTLAVGSPAPGAAPAAAPAPGAAAPAPAAAVPSAPPVNTTVTQAGFVSFPVDKMPAHTRPSTPLPAKIQFNDALLTSGNAANGQKLVSTGMCIACHTVRGVPGMVSTVAPNLTHIGSRTTIGAGLFPNDPRHLARWVKNAPAMKPGVTMPALGQGEYDPITAKGPVKIGFNDQQIADIVAYLQTLK